MMSLNHGIIKGLHVTIVFDSNSAHCEHKSLQCLMDHRCSYKYGICLMRISSVTIETVTDCLGPACRCFVLYSTSLNIGHIFLNNSVSSVHLLKIFNRRLGICIVLPHFYCNIVLLNIHSKMLK